MIKYGMFLKVFSYSFCILCQWNWFRWKQ